MTRAVLARALRQTYASAMGVDDDEALDRLGRALAHPGVLEDLHRGISAALAGEQGPRTTPDALVDRLSRGVEQRAGKVRAAPGHPAVAAVLVRLNLELGLAPEPMRETLRTEKGRALLEDGLRRLGAHLVAELLK
jgi:hypothetical protein